MSFDGIKSSFIVTGFQGKKDIARNPDLNTGIYNTLQVMSLI